MARQARVLSETGIYHIMFRGSNKQEIFSHERDYEKMKEIIFSVKNDLNMQIYAYCMMPNHVHLFVREEEKGDISLFMKRILSHYAGWYNFKYERIGHLFANRYKSIPVEDDSYLLVLSRYIHQNPVKAGIVKNIQDYEYSSYSDYLSDSDGFVDVNFLLDMLDENRQRAIKQFVSFSNSEEEGYDLQSKDGLTICKIIRLTGGMSPHEIRFMPKEERYRLLKKLMTEHNIPKTALERTVGISRRTLLQIETSQNGDSPQNEKISQKGDCPHFEKK